MLNDATLEAARDLARQHARKLREGEPITVASLLISVNRCPECAGPLLTGETTGRCSNCGTEVALTC